MTMKKVELMKTVDPYHLYNCVDMQSEKTNNLFIVLMKQAMVLCGTV